MNQEELKQRTKMFARRIIRLVQTLPENTTGRALGSQLIRSGTSVAANYRAACRAKSKADFISKMGTVEEEADESALWLDLLILERITNSPEASPLKTEAEELTAIAVASINTARGGIRSNPQSAIRNPQ
jgi:four helix bundle protein